MGLLVWLLIGLVAGALARLVVPGRDDIGLAGTIVLGLVGSIVGGVVAVMLTDRSMDEFSMAGLLGSILGAIAALVAYRFMQPRGRLTGRRGARL